MTDHGPATIDRHVRALRILTCLQSGPCFNAKKLAQQLRVSRRTIHRDLNLIREAGIQVCYDGRDSAYRLAPQSPQHLPPPTFDPEEVTTLAMAAHLSILHHLPDMRGAANLSVAKLLGAYPGDVRDSIARLLNACVLQLPMGDFSGRSREVIRTLLRAISTQSQVRCTIQEDVAQVNYQTLIAPYRLVVSLERWLLVGRSSIHRTVRSFPIAGIEAIELTEEPYQLPSNFHHRPYN